MAKLTTKFVTANAPESSSFEALPAGKYTCIISDSEMKETKAGTGQYLQCTLQIVDGQHKGRQTWARFNLVNPNATAVEIAERQFGELCRALKLAQVEDSQDLHDKPFIAKLKLRPASGEFDASNDVAAFETYTGAPLADASTAVTTAAPAPPWGTNEPTPF